MDRPALATALARAVPGLEVIAEPEALRPFETDGLTALRQLPLSPCCPRRWIRCRPCCAIATARGFPWWLGVPGRAFLGRAAPRSRGAPRALQTQRDP